MHRLFASLFVTFCILADRPESLEIPFTDTVPRLQDFPMDGRQPEGVFATVSGFLQREPEDGQPSTQETRVHLSYDRTNLYVIFQAFDSNPQAIRANMAPRESIDEDDSVSLVIDTFNDHRRGYAFLSTPRGIQWDALWTEENGFDSSYQAVWHNQAALTPYGFQVLFTIPFKSLRFPDRATQSWRVMFGRRISRLGEESYWPAYSLAVEGRLNQAGTMRGIESISPGRNFQVVPYGFARNFNALDAPNAGYQQDDFDGEAGVDAKLVIKDSFVLDATLNPDFSQVESDQPQVTVNQRFEVFFPERRPFFLENADVFRTPTNLVFTRRIADPSYGLKLTGKVGDYSVGAMVLDDEAPDRAQPGSGDAEVGVLRVARDISAQSRVGLIYTHRRHDGLWNEVGAADARIKWNDHWVTSAQAALSRTDSGSGDQSGDSYNVTLNRSGRHFSTHSHFLYTSEEFDTQLGFLGSQQRPDSQNLHHWMGYTFRPGNRSLSAFGPGLFLAEIWSTDGQRLEWNIEPEFKWQWAGHTRLLVKHIMFHTRLRPQDHSGITTTRDYSQKQWSFDLESELARRFVFTWDGRMGTALNFVPAEGAEPEVADLTTTSLSAVIRPIAPLRLDLNLLYTSLRDRNGRGKIFDNTIARLKSNWQFTREFSTRLIIEYRDIAADPQLTSIPSRKRLNADILLRYLINPWTAIYAGYNTNQSNRDLVQTPAGPQILLTDGELHTDARQSFIKVSYLFQY